MGEAAPGGSDLGRGSGAHVEWGTPRRLRFWRADRVSRSPRWFSGALPHFPADADPRPHSWWVPRTPDPSTVPTHPVSVLGEFSEWGYLRFDLVVDVTVPCALPVPRPPSVALLARTLAQAKAVAAVEGGGPPGYKARCLSGAGEDRLPESAF